MTNAKNTLIGQTILQNRLADLITYCALYDTPFPHTLFVAPPGYGKTTFARELAKGIKAEFFEEFGPQITQPEDVYNLFTKMHIVSNGRVVLFIDEIHALPRHVMELFYPILDLGKLVCKDTVIYAQGITILAGTTELHKVTKPFLDRINNQIMFEPYTEEDTKKLMQSVLPSMVYDPKVIGCIHKMCLGVPRKVKNLAQQLMYFTALRGITKVTYKHFSEFLLYIGFDLLGLDALERQYLYALLDLCPSVGDGVSLQTISSAIALNAEMVAQTVEPKLLALALIKITAKGRELTEQGRKHAA
jgi:Holliday junction DNA helicase RuvB